MGTSYNSEQETPGKGRGLGTSSQRLLSEDGRGSGTNEGHGRECRGGGRAGKAASWMWETFPGRSCRKHSVPRGGRGRRTWSRELASTTYGVLSWALPHTRFMQGVLASVPRGADPYRWEDSGSGPSAAPTACAQRTGMGAQAHPPMPCCSSLPDLLTGSWLSQLRRALPS